MDTARCVVNKQVRTTPVKSLNIKNPNSIPANSEVDTVNCDLELLFCCDAY